MNKKILHISYGGLSHGGVSSVIFSIVDNLFSSFDFDCVVFNARGEQESKFLQYGNLYRFPCYTVDKTNPFEVLTRPFQLFFRTFFLCLRNKYDVIHVHNMCDAGLCLLSAKLAGVPIRIAHSHTNSPIDDSSIIKRFYRVLNRFLVNLAATHKIGCSEKACRDFFGPTKYQVIYNSVDCSKFRFIDKSVNLDRMINFIHVGRFCSEKNQLFVLQVFKHLLSFLCNIHLYLIGYGEDLDLLKNYIYNNNLEEYVDLLDGTVADIPMYFRKSNFMIFPSKSEGFGIVLIEAQSSGCFCFVSEAIQNEVDLGYLEKIDLAEGPLEWAEHINQFIHCDMLSKKEFRFDMLPLYSKEHISKFYSNLYLGRLLEVS